VSLSLLPVVEGDGEVAAVPILLRRICQEVYGRFDVTIRHPWRLPRSKMVIPSEIARVYQVLAQGASGTGAVIVILDQDDDADVPDLAQRVRGPMGDMAPIQVVVARREFEAWFLGGAVSLRAHRSVYDDASFVGDPQAPRDAKGRMMTIMHERYRETLHQPAFSQILSIELARRRCSSFEHLVGAVGHLIADSAGS
jgi:hypothetical protein